MRRNELDRPFFDMSQADTEERNYFDITLFISTNRSSPRRESWISYVSFQPTRT